MRIKKCPTCNSTRMKGYLDKFVCERCGYTYKTEQRRMDDQNG